MNLSGLKIYVAGHRGLVGSAIVRRLSRLGDLKLVTAVREELDLTDGRAVERFLDDVRPDVVVMAAGKVGGVLANSLYPAEFIYVNLMIEANLIQGSWKAGAKRVLYFGSSCMYPKYSNQPLSPDLLMSGKLEPTSEPYAIAKLAGHSLCSSYNQQYGTSFVTAIPCNLYGPGDSFDPTFAHVVSALIYRFQRACSEGNEVVAVWGDGTARREFLYVDDLAEACELLLRCNDNPGPINIGSGDFVTIREIAEAVRDVVGFRGEICWNSSRPAGAPEKLLDSKPIRELGWLPRTDLHSGLERTYAWFLENQCH